MDGTELRAQRKRLGWTQTEMADALGLSLRTLQRYESADEVPRHIALAVRYIVEQSLRTRE
jgi:transcriptional regulator with XRE-family HTH domain